MKVKELRTLLNNLPDTANILLAKDEEINGYADKIELCELENEGFILVPLNEVSILE